jgi:uncharacterized protein with ParB-like and HNH nuclease domain
MKANDTSLRVFLEGSKQFLVPLFQRIYSWKRKNVQTMFEDLRDTVENGKVGHFFGSFVTMPLPTSASRVSQYTIIDGQQRLTTTCLLLAALRDRMLEIDPDYKRKEEINELYLLNKFADKERYKLVPTEADKRVFFSIIDNRDWEGDDSHRLVESFSYIRKELNEIDDLNHLEEMKDALISEFSIVDIRLEDNDDPYLIFESLNAKGSPLTQADLIRNYLFMGISQEKQHHVYKELWLPLQERLGDDIDAFFRHYLAMSGDIPNIKKVYSTFRAGTMGKFRDESSRERNVMACMADLKTHSQHYSKLLRPEEETAKTLRKHLLSLKRLQLTTSYPLLLLLYDDLAKGRITDGEFSKCVKLVESFVVRRAVCGIPTNVLNRYFPTVHRSLDPNDMSGSLRSKLQAETGSRRMPDDDEVRRNILDRKLYGTWIIRYLLEEIERFGNKEVVDFEGLQVEHIMPRTISDEWKTELGEEWELIHRKYVDTLGNLTLTGYNPEYSNRTFTEKRDMERGFRDSALSINRNLAKLNHWRKDEIEARGNELADIVLKVWAM